MQHIGSGQKRRPNIGHPQVSCRPVRPSGSPLGSGCFRLGWALAQVAAASVSAKTAHHIPEARSAPTSDSSQANTARSPSDLPSAASMRACSSSVTTVAEPSGARPDIQRPRSVLTDIQESRETGRFDHAWDRAASSLLTLINRSDRREAACWVGTPAEIDPRLAFAVMFGVDQEDCYGSAAVEVG